MKETTSAGCDPVERELGTQSRPTFKEWLNQNKIEFTQKEAFDWIMLAAKKGVSVQKLIGYPYA